MMSEDSPAPADRADIATFLERHPDVDPAELEALLERPRRRSRILVALSIILAVVMLTSAVLAWRVDHVIEAQGDEIASDIAQQRIDELDARFSVRLDEARLLAGDVFAFLVTLIESSPALTGVRDNFESASAHVDSLLLDVRAIEVQPIEAGRRLWKTGPGRLEAIVVHASDFFVAIEALIPRMLDAFREARTALGAEREIESVFEALNQLVEPLVQDDPRLARRWQRLVDRLTKFSHSIRRDVDTLGSSLDGGAMSREFIERVLDEVF